jgi:hypothetical protein
MIHAAARFVRPQMTGASCPVILAHAKQPSLGTSLMAQIAGNSHMADVVEMPTGFVA